MRRPKIRCQNISVSDSFHGFRTFVLNHVTLPGELDLHSASEDEGEDDDPVPMDEDEEEEADPDEDTHDSPVVTRPLAGFDRPAQSAIVQQVTDANVDDSATGNTALIRFEHSAHKTTESESDIELPPPLPLKRKSPDSSQLVPPVKRQRTASNGYSHSILASSSSVLTIRADDDSATESETDEDMGMTSPVKTSTQPPPSNRPAADPDSETESESESEMFSNPVRVNPGQVVSRYTDTSLRMLLDARTAPQLPAIKGAESFAIPRPRPGEAHCGSSFHQHVSS